MHTGPCPVGTYGTTAAPATAYGLKSSDECTDCPEKFYCPRKGMTTAESNDYVCKDGYLCAAGSETEEGSTICPIDSYCIAGTQYPCAEGTYSLV